MNLDELRTVQSKERQKDSLQNLRPSFYQEVGEYIADLEEERERVAGQTDDPFASPEVGRLTDEIETAKDVVEAIYERRMGKLVKQASLSAAGMPADDEGLTAEEADLFADLVDRIQTNKTRVLDVLEGAEADADGAPATETADEPAVPSEAPGHPEPDDPPPAPPEEPPSGSEIEPAAEPTGAEQTGDDSSEVTAADVMGGEGPSIDGADGSHESTPAAPSPDESAPVSTSGEQAASDPPDERDSTSSEDSATDGEDDVSDSIDRVTVRITRDIGPILGVDDREYTLSSDDVVTLPEQNASPLLERDAAEKLE